MLCKVWCFCQLCNDPDLRRPDYQTYFRKNITLAANLQHANFWKEASSSFLSGNPNGSDNLKNSEIVKSSLLYFIVIDKGPAIFNQKRVKATSMGLASLLFRLSTPIYIYMENLDKMPTGSEPWFMNTWISFVSVNIVSNLIITWKQ